MSRKLGGPRRLTLAEGCILAWARIHRQEHARIGPYGLLEAWIEDVETGLEGGIGHGMPRLRLLREMVVVRGLSLEEGVAAVLDSPPGSDG